ncbi:MAG TPA: ACT domain-containing protein [Terriglobales bacterium]|nr:ACT domain-containing protein [Terriglobales bacterium]
MKLRFRKLQGSFAICQLPARAPTPAWALAGSFTSISRSDDELSVVCPQAQVPAEIDSDGGWACLKLEGPFPFSETGILSSFIGPLSAEAIPIFAISTYDTDYVLVKEGFLDRALSTLQNAGHTFVR